MWILLTNRYFFITDPEHLSCSVVPSYLSPPREYHEVNYKLQNKADVLMKFFFNCLNAQLQAPLGKLCLAPGSKNLLDESASEKMCNQVSLTRPLPPASVPSPADWLAVPDGWAVGWALATRPTPTQPSPLTAFQAVPSPRNACLWGLLIQNRTAAKSCKSMKWIS